MEGDDMAESEDKGYEVIDKRKVRLGEDGEVHTEPESEAAEAQPEEQVEEPQAGQEEIPKLPPVDVHALVKSFIGILGAHAWQWMGLVRNPVTGEVEKDLAQAKVAIDAISALAGQIDSKLDERERGELQAMVSDLRINFVQQSARES
jgi:hypothetical protein